MHPVKPPQMYNLEEQHLTQHAGMQGAGLVVTGNVMQFKAHQALAGLSSALSTRKEEYRIPRGIDPTKCTAKCEVGTLLRQ